MDFNPVCLLDLLPTADDPVGVFAVQHLRDNLIKKLLPTDTTIPDQSAYALFSSMNEHCRLLGVTSNDVILRARAIIYDALYDRAGNPLLTIDECFRQGRPGPGASRGTRHTAFHMKMWNSKWTCTSAGLYRHFISSCSPHWQCANSLRVSRFGAFEVVEGSSMSCVPKTSKISRTICTEPSLNMFYQLGAGVVLERALKRGFGIDLSKQPEVNKSLARLGSISGRYATIDLRSASDTISTKLVAMLLPARDFALLNLLRSKKALIQGSVVDLHSFSTMGNGFTFPLQTLIFAALLKAYLEESDISFLAGHVPVFGDDIICPSKAFDGVTELLEHCGFFVNFDKSFASGFFRESCGGDYFHGVDVRSVYLKKWGTVQDVYSLFNRLARWSAKHKISIQPMLASLLRLVPIRPVPFDEADTSGIKMPMRALLSAKRDRNMCIYYHALVPVPVVKRAPDLLVNPEACLISSIGGYLRDTSYAPRLEVQRWQVLKRKTPSWDYVPEPGLTSRDFTHVESVLLSL